MKPSLRRPSPPQSAPWAAAQLERWTSRSRFRTNIVVTVATITLMIFLLPMAAALEPEVRDGLLYRVGLAMTLVHGALHGLSRGVLHLLTDRQVPGAAHAYRAYLDPRCISQLDLAMAWLGYGVIAHQLV